MVQSSLVEVLPVQVGVEVTLVPGIDIASRIFALLDLDRDGAFSEIESEAWSELFMSRQSVTVDGQSLPLNLHSVRATPLAEMTNGHAEIVVHFTADIGPLARGPRTIVCATRYEPIPCDYQGNGLVPKSPGVRITSHRRDERQQALTLGAESSGLAAPVVQSVQPANMLPKNRSAAAIPWLVGLSLAGAFVAVGAKRRLSPARAEL